MANSTKRTQAQKWYEVIGIAGTWARGDGVRRALSTTKVRDGGGPAETIVGESEYDNLPLRRPYDLRRDQAVWRQLNDAVGLGREYVIISYYRDNDGTVLKGETYNGRILECTPPSADADSSAAGELVAVFSVDTAS